MSQSLIDSECAASAKRVIDLAKRVKWTVPSKDKFEFECCSPKQRI